MEVDREMRPMEPGEMTLAPVLGDHDLAFHLTPDLGPQTSELRCALVALDLVE